MSRCSKAAAATSKWFYLSPDNQIMAVDVRGTSAGLSTSTPHQLVASAGPFDVDPTGQRFLVVTPKQSEQLYLVTNWFGEIARQLKP